MCNGVLKVQKFHQPIKTASANSRPSETGGHAVGKDPRDCSQRFGRTCKGFVFNAFGLVCFLATPGYAQLIVAHRGASHAAPENTAAAFELAWQQKADAIEADFRLSQDGQIVCIHDATTQRTAGVDWKVCDKTLAELKTLDVGRWKEPKFKGEEILTLSEVLRLVPRDKKIFVELKSGPEIVKPLQEVLKKSQVAAAQMLVITFNEETAREVKRSLPHLKVHWLTGLEDAVDSPNDDAEISRITDSLSRTGADGLGSEAKRTVLTDAFIQKLTAKGLPEFHVWTVDDPQDAIYYQDLGAFSITTNRPGFLRKKLSQVGEGK